MYTVNGTMADKREDRKVRKTGLGERNRKRRCDAFEKDSNVPSRNGIKNVSLPFGHLAGRGSAEVH